MRVSLRDATSADSDVLFVVRESAFRQYVELNGGWDATEERRLHTERLARQRFRIIVADGTDVGFVATAVYTEETERYPSGLYVHQLMVMPQMQSKGVGASCFRILAGEASVADMPLRLRVLKVNSRARAFYEPAGCIVVGESASHWAMEMNA